ncbi:NADPH-dependent FMN reductase [Kaistella antarctica]|uniref:ACP phosphodiesterase n=1 Tax=Kaistella antarctica TaxID=266748 RepID=A0A448NP19_9FLAO|nr:NAD(P)H-dependent oxidoreductase [Kaistella antarctica]KEY19587.1 ACP phosphodiesterase [Kaistella antarctica]SEW08708.1 chromate reductase [Kaistella antarctica]VEH97048.1 FMN-dependent NADPH-azoreductase [Kaistella antarctica]
MQKKVALIVGSLRKESFNRKVANEFIRFAPDNLKLEIVEIKELSFFNEDIENNPPQEWLDYKKQLDDADAFLFVSPEYNRTIPGVLKNAMEIGARPPKENSWKGKPGAVVTVSPGLIGGLGANQTIREAAVSLNIPMMQQPEAYIGQIKDKLLEDGVTVNEKTEKFMKTFLEAFEIWVNRF